MKTVNYDALASCAPIDKQAALVVGQDGEHFAERAPPQGYPRWDAPPVLKPLLPTADGIAMIGMQIGRLTVLGVADLPRGKQAHAVWVCRCECGAYEGRKLRALRQATPGTMLCLECARLTSMRRAEHRRLTGRSTPIEDFL